MTKPPSVQLPALFVRLPLPTHELLRQLAGAADESLSRYVIALIESRRPGGARLPSRRPRVRERVAVVAPQLPVEVAVDAAPRRPRGRPRKVPLADAVIVATPPRKRRARVALETRPAVDAAPVEELLEQPVIAAPPSSRTDTLDRIRAALASLDAPPPVEELADESASRVVVEDAP
jgi:hypothetical protein